MTNLITMTPGELRPGMIVQAHGMRILIVDEPSLSRSHPGERTYYTTGIVTNRDEVSSDAVPYSFTAPRQVWSDEQRRWVTPDGPHVWTLQGNDLASVAVEADSIEDDDDGTWDRIHGV